MHTTQQKAKSCENKKDSPCKGCIQKNSKEVFFIFKARIIKRLTYNY